MAVKLLLCLFLASVYFDFCYGQNFGLGEILDETDAWRIHSTNKYALRTKCKLIVDLRGCLHLSTTQDYYYPCDDHKYIHCSLYNMFSILRCQPKQIFNPLLGRCSKYTLLKIKFQA